MKFAFRLDFRLLSNTKRIVYRIADEAIISSKSASVLLLSEQEEAACHFYRATSLVKGLSEVDLLKSLEWQDSEFSYRV
jgi:hypothetical protein